MHLLDEIKEANKERDWRWERVGWGLMVAIVIVELFGLFGGGVLAQTTESRTIGDAEYRITYDRYNRQLAASFLDVDVFAPDATGDTLKVSFSDTLTTGWVLRSSNPTGDGSSVAAAGQTYEYQVDDWDQPAVLTFDYLPRESGIWDGRVTVQAGGSDPVVFDIEQRIFP